jgi:hypothetical protein
VRQTSLIAWGELTKDKLSRNQSLVYEAIEEHQPVSDKQLAEILDWPINSITPRRGELFNKHRIVVAEVAKDLSGRKVTFWKTKDVGVGYED